MPCERIGHQFALGQVTENNIELNFESIAKKYNSYYNRLDKQCQKCYNKKTCTQCVFNLPNIEKKPVCSGFMSRKDFEAYQKNQLSFLAQHPDSYYKIMTEVLIK